jgi:hypothetical protein
MHIYRGVLHSRSNQHSCFALSRYALSKRSLFQTHSFLNTLFSKHTLFQTHSFPNTLFPKHTLFQTHSFSLHSFPLSQTHSYPNITPPPPLHTRSSIRVEFNPDSNPPNAVGWAMRIRISNITHADWRARVNGADTLTLSILPQSLPALLLLKVRDEICGTKSPLPEVPEPMPINAFS